MKKNIVLSLIFMGLWYTYPVCALEVPVLFQDTTFSKEKVVLKMAKRGTIGAVYLVTDTPGERATMYFDERLWTPVTNDLAATMPHRQPRDVFKFALCKANKLQPADCKDPLWTTTGMLIPIAIVPIRDAHKLIESLTRQSPVLDSKPVQERRSATAPPGKKKTYKQAPVPGVLADTLDFGS